MAVQLMSAVHLLLYSETSLLMIRRCNTGWEDGNFSVVAGHIEQDESARDAMAREAKEEAGIVIDTDDLEFAHVMHRNTTDGPSRLDFFFRCTKWQGQVQNAEPHKCDLMDWYAPNQLPENTVSYIRAALTHVHNRQPFSEFGWDI